ncbi:MAG: hypothetical protein FWE15_20970 [Actinomycetia bacterium]|nr:hypothetical protein [Actinomycetes bacterium]
MPPATYETLERFLRQRPARREPGDVYGTGWHADGINCFWQLAYQRATGELYAVADADPRPVIVLAVLEPGDDPDAFHRALGLLLGRYANPHVSHGLDLDWLLARTGRAGNYCPGCGTPAALALGNQSFCSGPDACPVFCWDPADDLAATVRGVQLIDLGAGERGT